MTRKTFTTLLLIAAACVQCSINNKERLLTENALPVEYFTINPDKDTILHTAKGAIINIPKGSLEAHGNTSVKLEVKEAYTMSDMVLGGLTTKAGKTFLSSGGMIYVNPLDDNVKIIQPIAISIPTKYEQDGMQLYKGKKNADGSIDWTEPQPLVTQALPAPLAQGKALFTNNCASCHDIIKEATGPPLAFLDKRRDWYWLSHFVYNSAEMIAHGDEQAICIFEHYNKTAQTAFPDLTDEEIHRIFDYVDYKAGSIDPSTIPDFQKAFDSCARYIMLKNELAGKKNNLIIDNGPQTEIKAVDPIPVTPENGPGTKPANMVHAAANDAVYYKFNIQVFGWYNVDVLFRDLPGFEKSVLTVRATGEYKEDINIYLVIPAYKVFVPGGPVAEKKDEYAFFTNDGQTPLPQNTKAYIIAMGDYKGQVWFGKTDFITSRQQSPQIQLTAMTKEQMNMEVQKLDISGLDITATDSRNADKIRKIDAKLSELEKLKPIGCDCNCLEQHDTVSSE